MRFQEYGFDAATAERCRRTLQRRLRSPGMMASVTEIRKHGLASCPDNMKRMADVNMFYINTRCIYGP